MNNLNHPYAFKNSKIFIGILFLVFYPLGVYKIIKLKYPRWAQAVYIILGLPLFLIVVAFLIIILLGAILPDLDRSTSPHLDRTVWNKEGNYSCTFVKTRSETGNAYELMKLEVEPKGGNWWHYHSAFDEEFTVISGELTVEVEGEKRVIKRGESTVVPKTNLHQFHNSTDSVTTVLVRITPAAGLEKTIRIAYGLINKGEMDHNSGTVNPWHLILLTGYSNSYPPPVLPMWIQEPFVDGLAKIAQWKGEDKTLEVYFK